MFGKRKQKKTYKDDDGRTIVDMNIDGFPWYNPTRKDKDIAKEDRPTRKEMFALIRGVFAAYLPRFLTLLLGFGLAIGIIYCWLHGWFIN